MDLEVKPENWVLSNRIDYSKYVYNMFHPSKYPMKVIKQSCECSKDACDVSTPTVMLFSQQRIVRDYIQVDSPYRGILLYHELGSGKSAASIAAAEGYIERKKVYILTPSSLAQNYENELLKISKLGLNLKKSWSLVKLSKTTDKKEILNQYAISSKLIKGSNVWIPLYNNDIKDAIVIKNVSYNKLESSEKIIVEDTIKNIINNRYNFISYNGLTRKNVSEYKKNGFDNSFVVIDEIHNFISRVVNGSILARSIYNSLMNANNCKLVLLSGTPIINSPYEIATLINLIRGPMKQYKLKLLKNSKEISTSEIIEYLTQTGIYKYIDMINYETSDKSISILLLPNNYIRNDNSEHKLIKSEWRMSDNEIIQNVIQTLNKKESVKISIKHSHILYYALPSSDDEFKKSFIDDSDIDNLKIKNEDLFKRRILGTLSYYKTTGTELFPTVLPNKIQKLNITTHQMSLYKEVRDKERKIDDAKKKTKHLSKENIFADKSSVYRAFSRLVCNFAFPENIERVFPQDIKNVMKSEFVIEENDEDEEEENNKLTVEKKEINKKSKAEYENKLDNAIMKLNEGDYLEKNNLKNNFSPKFAKMIDDIEESPGSVLVYSQFRKVEGIGIFSLALNKNGYKEINLKKTDNGYEFDDLEVFDKKYDNKRYVVFNSDRIKTNILMNLFNGSFSLLPDNLKKQIPHNEQLYGKLVKIMMITQSAAEGISLKNVRRVLIMEYFWNSVRINQVIGRAVRTCSHEELPKEDRNVQIYTYIMTFTKEQLKNNFSIKTLDSSLTTDEHILNLATKKEIIINQFLNMLKAASFDCIINSVQNKPLSNGYKCYNWAINANKNDLTYTPNINDDKKILKHKKLQVLKTNKGLVVIKDGRKYVLLNDKLYDYFSYKNAGILMEI